MEKNEIFVGNVDIQEMYLNLNGNYCAGITPKLFYQLLSEFPHSVFVYSSEDESLTFKVLKP